MKLKHRETVEVVCGAVIGPITQPSEIVAGLTLDGELRIVGRSTPLKTAAGRELARWLKPPRSSHPWPKTVKGTTLDRLNRDKEPVTLTLVEPVVVEVSAGHSLVRPVLPPSAAPRPGKARALSRGYQPAGYARAGRSVNRRPSFCQAMGWISNDNEHEGYAACVAPDGRLSGSSTAGGMLFKGLTGHYPPDTTMTDYEVIPDSQIIGWRGACECGWRGELWERVTSPAAADFSRRRDYVSPEEFANASDQVEGAIHDEWKAHVAPSEAILGVEAAAREYHQAGHRLDKTVAAAKAAGASWADIGRAVGISRQSAHERWADRE